MTALVTTRLDTEPSGLGPLAAEMVDPQRGLARDTGEAAAVIDLADALGIFARVAAALRRPDLMRVALADAVTHMVGAASGSRRRLHLHRHGRPARAPVRRARLPLSALIGSRRIFSGAVSDPG